MEITVPIVIPTAGRAKAISSYRYVSDTIICVAESEADLYKENNPGQSWVTHPDSVKGIAEKRQWIYDQFGNVFMMDDDLTGLKKLTPKAGEKDTTTPEQANAIIQNCANLAKIAGCYLFGFNNFVRPEHYHGHTPFALSGYINGCGLRLLEGGADKLKFDKLIKTNNDFYIAGLNAFYYRKNFIDKRYAFNQDSFANNLGGCSDVRTNEAEKSDFELLEKYFGSAMQIKKHGLFRSKHAYSKRLIIPY